jgi:hypothetical protein
MPTDHREKLHNLNCGRIEVDEVWGFFGMKQKTPHLTNQLGYKEIRFPQAPVGMVNCRHDEAGQKASRRRRLHADALHHNGAQRRDYGGCEREEMTVLGDVVLLLGAIVCLYGQVRFLVVAYNRSLWWFFGCLFVPLVDWIFFFLNLKTTIRPFTISIAGLIVAAIGAWLAGIHG